MTSESPTIDLSAAINQLHAIAVESLTQLIRNEKDPRELRRLVTIALRFRDPNRATKRREPEGDPSAPSDFPALLQRAFAQPEPRPEPADQHPPARIQERASSIPRTSTREVLQAFDDQQPLPVARARSSTTPPETS